MFGTVPEVGEKPSPDVERETRRCLVRRSSSSLMRPGNGMSLGSLYFAIVPENGGTGDNPPRGGGTGLTASDSNEAADECACPCEICEVGLPFIAPRSVFVLAPLSLLTEVSAFSSFRDRAKLLDRDRRPVSVVLTLSHLDADVLPLSRFFLDGDRSKRRDDSRSVWPSRSVWTSSQSVKMSEWPRSGRATGGEDGEGRFMAEADEEATLTRARGVSPFSPCSLLEAAKVRAEDGVSGRTEGDVPRETLPSSMSECA